MISGEYLKFAGIATRCSGVVYTICLTQPPSRANPHAASGRSKRESGAAAMVKRYTEMGCFSRQRVTRYATPGDGPARISESDTCENGTPLATTVRFAGAS